MSDDTKAPTFIFNGEGKGTELGARTYRDYIFKMEGLVAQRLKGKAGNVFDVHHREDSLDTAHNSEVYWFFVQTTSLSALQIVKQSPRGNARRVFN